MALLEASVSRFSVKARMQRLIFLRKGELVLRADSAQLGSPSHISRALKALQAEGTIVRLCYGVYAKVPPSILSGKPIPRITLEENAATGAGSPAQTGCTRRTGPGATSLRPRQEYADSGAHHVQHGAAAHFPKNHSRHKHGAL